MWIGRFLVLCAWGVAGVLWTIAWDAYRPGSLPFATVAQVSIAVLTVGLVGALVAAALGSWGGDSGRLLRGLILLGVLAALAGGAGLAFLMQRGKTVRVLQYVKNGFAEPMLTGVVSRTPDNWIELSMHDLDVELTKYPLDVSPSIDQLLAAADLYTRSRQAAEKFRDYQQTRTTLGFTISNAEVLGRPQAEFIHLINPDYMRDGVTLDPERPESLVFQKRPEGYRLVGYMYMMPPGQHGPQIGGSMTRWHYHKTVEFCMDKDGIPTVAAKDNQCPPGQFYGPTPEMMHVWLVNARYGVFSHMMELEPDAGQPAPPAHQHHH
jgi:hypothetical protein